MLEQPNAFIWYELMTIDTAAALSFYGGVVSWSGTSFDGTPDYTLLQVGDRGVGGIMPLPEHLMQAGMPPLWVGYIFTRDVDASVKAVKHAGGTVHRAAWDIPGVGRIAVVADPQGALFHLITPSGADMPPISPKTKGAIGWHELLAEDGESALAFYASQYGWKKDRDFDMGEMGTYHIFSTDGDSVGGIFTKPDAIPSPFWLFYFTVSNIDEAAQRVSAGGGKILIGPMEVPNGGWILQARDPQGAVFALVGDKS